MDEPVEEWPRDHELLATASGMRPEDVAPYTFGPPVSPHYAAELAGVAVGGLPMTDPRSLAQAGAALPLDDWF